MGGVCSGILKTHRILLLLQLEIVNPRIFVVA